MSAESLSYAADLRVGTRYELGTYVVSLDEIVEFAKLWDPQPFHVDEAAGRASVFGEVIGSGLHTMAILQKLTVERVLLGWAVIAGRRIGEIELTAPLTGGSVLTGTVTIEAITPEPTRERAVVVTRGELVGAQRALLSARFEIYVHDRKAT